MAPKVLAPETMESKSMIKRQVEKIRRPVWSPRICLGLGLAALAALIALVVFQTTSERSLVTLPAMMMPDYWSGETTNGTTMYTEQRTTMYTDDRTTMYTDDRTTMYTEERTTMYIEDVIHMDIEILVLVRKSPNAAFPSKSAVECRYGNATLAPTALHLYSHRAVVLCPAPPREHPWDMHSISIALGQDEEIHPKVSVRRWPLDWLPRSKLAYEAFVTGSDVVMFVHGVTDAHSRHRPVITEPDRMKAFRCVYGEEYHETKVTAQSQGVFRCALPPADLAHQLAGKKITVKYYGAVLPSVAYYYPQNAENVVALRCDPPHSENANGKVLESWTAPSYYICSCTMIYNAAKFLKEWVHYNSHLGVQKFFLYDNNSDDDLDEVITSLNAAGFNVQKRAWPWAKTQEAGFSHCSVSAQSECEWMLFTDVDEYFFPNKYFLKPVAKTSILAHYISTHSSSKVGQISALCYDFGPSGWTMSPPQGVTQGYTCRARKTERHKSIVQLRSLESNLENVIHHFTLKRGLSRKLVGKDTAVVYHYKFQAWDEFKTKFHRRASMHVADWSSTRNQASKDRVRDLGTAAIKPKNWESRYCDVHDYKLQYYTKRIFGTYDQNKTLHFPWE